MKQFLACLLCIFTLYFLFSCDKNPPPSSDGSDTQIDTVQNTTQDESDTNDDAVTNMRFGDYHEILNTISNLYYYGELDQSKYADLDERESEIYENLSHFICEGSGYCIKDINGDGIDELIMITGIYTLKGLFTLKDGLPVLLATCDNGAIGKDGKIRLEHREETILYIRTVYRLKAFTGNTLSDEIELERTIYPSTGRSSEYYSISDGERTAETYSDFENLILSYEFYNYIEQTQAAGITNTNSLGIPFVGQRGNYFLTTFLVENNSRIYTVKIYDKNGKEVSSLTDSSISAYEYKTDENETVVRVYHGDHTLSFYNVSRGCFSESFSNVHDLFNNNNMIVYTSGSGKNARLVVQDIFEPEKYYRAYEHEAFEGTLMTVEFAPDVKSIFLKYKLPTSANSTTRVLCLEELPIVKTVKICYVRHDTSISENHVYQSSGVRAVLRADTGDTARLISNGSIVGDKYTSDDGTVRNDWYCIYYRGEVCYVTADSFEVDSQHDIPVVSTVPYTFISKQERLSWKDRIVTILSNEREPYGSLGAALMDINFDNTPELIIAYSGGSMGNVCLDVYDLTIGNRICYWGDAPSYGAWNDVYFAIYLSNDGNYILINKGGIRNGLESYFMTSTIDESYRFDVLFKTDKTPEDVTLYYYDGKEVTKEEYNSLTEAFYANHKEIKKTQLEIIYWDDLNTDSPSEMADKLISSDQQFIRFEASTPTVDTSESKTYDNYKQAYIDFLKDKQGPYRLFSLVFIDGDDIPELYLMGSSEAQGDMVCSFKNGSLTKLQLSRTGGGRYIERSGDIINQNGHMGLYYDNVYKLDENGFSQILSAKYTERYEDIGNGEYNTYREYFIDNVSVSETNYNTAVSSAFDLSQSVRLDANAVSYDAILWQFCGGYPNGK